MTRQEILSIAKPILFNKEMVQAIQGDRKSVTRRVIKWKPHDIYKMACANGKWSEVYGETIPDHLIDWHVHEIYKPKYKPGDYLYVRETWERFECANCEGDLSGRCFNAPADASGCYVYRATHEINGDARWHPSIHMPKEAARIFLKVTGVRVQRLQDMETPDDKNYLAEGAKDKHDFIRIWDETLKPEDCENYGWYANPWVTVTEFERVYAEEDMA